MHHSQPVNVTKSCGHSLHGTGSKLPKLLLPKRAGSMKDYTTHSPVYSLSTSQVDMDLYVCILSGRNVGVPAVENSGSRDTKKGMLQFVVVQFLEQLSSHLKSCCQEAEHLMPKLGAECTTKVKDSIWDHRAASDLLHVVQVARLLLRFVLKSPSQFVLAFSTLAPLQQPQHS